VFDVLLRLFSLFGLTVVRLFSIFGIGLLLGSALGAQRVDLKRSAYDGDPEGRQDIL
jgi:hypothetical protein